MEAPTLKAIAWASLVVSSGLVVLACSDDETSKSPTVTAPDASFDAPASDTSVADSASSPGAPSGVSAAAVPITTTVSTLAGSGTPAFAEGTGVAASFNGPQGVTVDAAGNVFVANNRDNHIVKVTAAGVMTSLAGSGTNAFANGTGDMASFGEPQGVAVDVMGNVYVADNQNNRIRKVTSGGVVTTLAGSGTGSFADATGILAGFRNPAGIGVDAAGNVYVGDGLNHRIRKVTPAGAVSTLAGSGVATFAEGTGIGASFNEPVGVAVDAAGNVYVADAQNNRIRTVTPAGVVTTLAGSGTADFANGTGAAASFKHLRGMAFSATGNLYVADTDNNCIRRVTLAGVVTTVAGTVTPGFGNGDGATAMFNGPVGVAVDAAGNVYVGDLFNNRIRKVTTSGVGELAVTWTAPSSTGSSAITGYTASASAAGKTTQTCTTTGATSCTIKSLTTGTAYDVSVTATSAAGTGASSTASAVTPN